MYEIYTDGSCDNAYQGQGVGAAAVLVKDTVLLGAVVARLPAGTNNIAEMLGVYLAVREVYPKRHIKYCSEHKNEWPSDQPWPDECGNLCPVHAGWSSPWSNEDVTVYSDSQYVVKGLNDWIMGWKLNGWQTADKKPVKNVTEWKALSRANAGFHGLLRHVKGHSGIIWNELADVLADDARRDAGLLHNGKSVPHIAVLTAEDLTPMFDGVTLNKPKSRPSTRSVIRKQFEQPWQNPFLTQP